MDKYLYLQISIKWGDKMNDIVIEELTKLKIKEHFKKSNKKITLTKEELEELEDMFKEFKGDE